MFDRILWRLNVAGPAYWISIWRTIGDCWRCAGCGGCPSWPAAGAFCPAGGWAGCPGGGCCANPNGLSEARTIAMKIQLRQKELEKFINWGIDNRSGRIGVIHDDDVTNVNRKTILPVSCPRNSRYIHCCDQNGPPARRSEPDWR